jgi:hypothetical protein
MLFDPPARHVLLFAPGVIGASVFPAIRQDPGYLPGYFVVTFQTTR